MTRGERISKLSNAIRAYRGICDSKTGRWIVPPQPKARRRVETALVKLRLPLAETMEKIAGFKTGDTFRAWLRTL